MAAATATFISISHPLLFSPSFIPKPKRQISSNSCNSHPSFPPPPKLVQSHLPSSSRYLSYQSPLCPAPLSSKRWELSAHQGTLFLLDISPVEESAQEIVSTTTDGGGSSSSIVQLLIFVAFIGLSVLTIGFGPSQVIYIAVTDFLQKREREGFEKEEAAKEKNSGKKGKSRTRGRAAPRGFGQKIEEAEIDESVTE